MLPVSLRWRLPLGYAAIAFLTALALGAVQLMVLQSYYRQQERLHLTRNGQVIAVLVAQMQQDGQSTQTIQRQIDNLAFVAQARVRVADNRGQILIDSGRPGVVQLAVNLTPPTSPTEDKDGAPLQGVFGVLPGDLQAKLTEPVPPDGGPPLLFPPAASAMPLLPTDEKLPVLRGDGLLVLPVADTLYGWGLGDGLSFGGRRSEQRVRVPITHESGETVGYIELSDGPANGEEIVVSVAWGWGIAGAVALLLATLAGWQISRGLTSSLHRLTMLTARMAAGNLSVRAPVERTDEVGALAAAFNEMAQRIEEMVTTLRRFVADAAHQFHTPLTALRTNLELAAAGQVGDPLKQAQTQILRLEKLTQDLLDLSRLEEWTFSGQREMIDLGQVLRELSEFYASTAEQREISFTLTVPEESWLVEGQAAWLRQALANVMDNALKFTPAGGRVDVGLARDNNHLLLWVEDTGIGIPAAELPLIFERFYRTSNASGIPGNGLGLALVQRIVQQHGGGVNVQSRPGETRFTLSLPQSAPSHMVHESGSSRSSGKVD